MNKEEQEAINNVDKFVDTIMVILPKYSTKIPEYCIKEEDWLSIKQVLNLIDKLQKENEIYLKDLEEMTKSNKHKKENWIHKSVLNSYVRKDKIRELREIDNIDYLQFKLKELLNEDIDEKEDISNHIPRID